MVESATAQFIKYFAPKPSPFKFERFGGRRDGAYLLPDDLEGVVACFSPGVENRKAFEDALLHRFGIRSHMVDFSSEESEFSPPLDRTNQTFLKKWLGSVGGVDTITLDEWVNSKEGVDSGDLLLQMDIEGSEYEVLDAVSTYVLERFRIIVFELHGIPDKLGLTGKTPKIADFIEKLSGLFTVVHAHPNNCSGASRDPSSFTIVPEVMEFVLIRNDRFFTRSDFPMFPPSVPHPKDILSNCRVRPPIFLNSKWLVTRRPILSKLRIGFEFTFFLMLVPLLFARKVANWLLRPNGFGAGGGVGK